MPTALKMFGKKNDSKTNKCVEQLLSCGYRKGLSAKRAYVSLTEKWNHQVDKKAFAVAVLINLSNEPDAINYMLLLAKLKTSAFDKNAF